MSKELFKNKRENIRETLLNTEHGRYLTEIGFIKDVELASEVDIFPVVPVIHHGLITKVK